MRKTDINQYTGNPMPNGHLEHSAGSVALTATKRTFTVIGKAILTVLMVMPVSYTHLDVYKRQGPYAGRHYVPDADGQDQRRGKTSQRCGTFLYYSIDGPHYRRGNG